MNISRKQSSRTSALKYQYFQSTPSSNSTQCRNIPSFRNTHVCYQQAPPNRKSELEYDPFEVLKVAADPSKLNEATLREAYLERSKQLHPDLNPKIDTTQQMAQVNEAYDFVRTALKQPEKFRSLFATYTDKYWAPSQDQLDEFDVCNGEPNKVFVNPFQCAVDPFMWEELNQAAQGLEDVEMGLYRMGVSEIDEYAIYKLTEEQYAAISRQFSTMMSMNDVQVTEYMVATQLAKARFVNDQEIMIRRRRKAIEEIQKQQQKEEEEQQQQQQPQ